jgi:hypothetical protein
MDYFTTCRIGGEGWGKYNTHTRGSFSFADAYDGGMINHFHPNSTMNFDEACDKAGIPIISHETGQFQTYPDYREIKKYTGVLHPYNFEVFRRRLAAAGMLSQADDFHKASGLWSVKLYKADIEMDLRTRNMAGFQLLDIQDYPGQGSAFVGIMDSATTTGMTSTQPRRRRERAVVITGTAIRATTAGRKPLNAFSTHSFSLNCVKKRAIANMIRKEGRMVPNAQITLPVSFFNL